MAFSDHVQELRELGLPRTLFRMYWELGIRSGLRGQLHKRPHGEIVKALEQSEKTIWTPSLPFGKSEEVALAMQDRVGAAARTGLLKVAEDATRGRIQCFSRWSGDFGNPIDWQRDPSTGKRWNVRLPWSKALTENVGDIKFVWELGRFPHAYHLSRASVFFPERRSEFAQALVRQYQGFLLENPLGYGVHWGSGQEIAFRLMAWLFSFHAMIGNSAEDTSLMQRALLLGAWHVRSHVSYARYAVYNNHILSEALLLYLAGTLLPHPVAKPWADFGKALLLEQVERQFYEDGGYIQQSHNYHRVALQIVLWAAVVAKAVEGEVPPGWLSALERSLDFLVAEQNPADGRLPNYGHNDGALPSILNTCDYSDFRPVLQAVSLISRGERLYDAGPWDECAAWFLGPNVLESSLRKPRFRSVSFARTGFHVLRGTEPETFAMFRCGSLRDRFSQIDMLHLDVWWRGENVLIDGGSFLYNGPRIWIDHFTQTGVHNTVKVDGRDQMLHFRRFKMLYWTQARLLRFDESRDRILTEGEHYGYTRHRGNVVHRRTVLFHKNGLWVVVDRLLGLGAHVGRLHWLAADYPYEPVAGGLVLTTERGPFQVCVYDIHAQPCEVQIVRGRENPLTGFYSRYYGERSPCPSLVSEHCAVLPMTWVSVLGPNSVEFVRTDKGFCARASEASLDFTLDEEVKVTT